MKVCITGAAGFLGRHLTYSFYRDQIPVVLVDDFRTGRRDHLKDLLPSPNVRLCEGNVLDQDFLEDAIRGCDLVVHLQAYADVQTGTNRPTLALRQNALATSTVLEAMRAAGVETIALASTSAVYGDATVVPTPEDHPFPEQTSLYGASKLYAEGMVSAYCHSLGFTGVALRFVPLLGEGYAHGHLFDFYKRLKQDPTRLVVLGDGMQRKSYLWAGDAAQGIRNAVFKWGKFIAYNVGTDETWTVRQSVLAVIEHLGIDPDVEYVGGERGWAGDSPLVQLDCTRLRECLWEPELTIEQAVTHTLKWFDANPDLFS